MSLCIKVILLLVAMVYISAAIRPPTKNSCFCQHLRPSISPGSRVKEIQAYGPSLFCKNLEIVVTEESGFRYCLNPEGQSFQRIFQQMQKKRSNTSPTQSSQPASV
ncbi:uncharacterized protein ACB058_006117 [Synchiropus picturatus]